MAKTISITNARKDIYKLSEEVCETHEEVVVYNGSTGHNMVILSEEDWNAIKETLYIESIPGLSDGIKKAAEDPDSKFSVYDPKEEW